MPETPPFGAQRRLDSPPSQRAGPVRNTELASRANSSTSRREWFLGAAGVATAAIAGSVLKPGTAHGAASILIDADSNQTITGIKTFLVPPIVPANAFPETAISGLVAHLAEKQPLISAGTYLAAQGVGTKSGPLTITTASGTVSDIPLTLEGHPATVTDHLRIVGPPRSDNPADGRYRIVVDRNIGLQTNAAISVTTRVWHGSDQSIPPPLAQNRPYCIGVDSDIVGPTLYLHGNGVGSHIEVQDHLFHNIFEVTNPPDTGGLGGWVGIGEGAPIATLTLSDRYDEPAGGAPVSLVLRHGRGTGSPASVRFSVPTTGDLQISANSESGENSLSEWALVFGHGTQGFSFMTAAQPGEPRSEVGRFVSNGLLFKAPAATSQAPERTSPTLTFQSTFWSSGNSVTRGFRVKDVPLGGGLHALQIVTDESGQVCMAIGSTGQVGVGDPFAANLASGQLHVVAQVSTTPAIVADVGANPASEIQKWRAAGSEVFAIGPSGIPKWSSPASQQTTVGDTGSASALPARPATYLKVRDSDGATYVIPAYKAG